MGLGVPLPRDEIGYIILMGGKKYMYVYVLYKSIYREEMGYILYYWNIAANSELDFPVESAVLRNV